MSLWVVVSIAVAVAIVGVLAIVFLPGRKTDIEAFTQARSLTNRWAQHPETAPPSIREMARRSAAGEDLVVPEQAGDRSKPHSRG